MTPIHTTRQIFEKYVPEAAVDYCSDLLNHYGFQFKITRSRKTKLGDYRFLSHTRKHVITVNHDLNKFQFLVTYLHEVAHLITFESHQHRVQPHGIEWKRNFSELLVDMNISSIFPEELGSIIQSYIKNPKASSCADPTLFKALSKYDVKKNGEKFLADLKPGDVFRFNNRLFQKELKKRTRSVCLDMKTGKQYLIPEVATVYPKDLNPDLSLEFCDGGSK